VLLRTRGSRSLASWRDHVGRQNRLDNAQTTQAANVADDMNEGAGSFAAAPFHVLNLRCSGRNQVKAMALETTAAADHVLWAGKKHSTPKTVQSLDPLAVLDVSLTSRDVAQMPSIDQKHFDGGRFQLLVERYPVDPR